MYLVLGTFVYVALIEILLEEFDDKHADRHAHEMIIIEKDDRVKHISKHKKFFVAILGTCCCHGIFLIYSLSFILVLVIICIF
jgi:hypothetical protein